MDRIIDFELAEKLEKYREYQLMDKDEINRFTFSRILKDGHYKGEELHKDLVHRLIEEGAKNDPLMARIYKIKKEMEQV